MNPALIFKKRKCPHCGSTRYHENNGLSICEKCGYTNDKNYLTANPKLSKTTK